MNLSVPQQLSTSPAAVLQRPRSALQKRSICSANPRSNFYGHPPLGKCCRLSIHAGGRLKHRNLECQAFSDSDALPQQQQQQKNPFQGYSQQLDGLQKVLGDTPKPALLFAALASVAASGYLGNLLGSQAPAAQRLVARALGAAVAAGVALFGVNKLKETRESAAVLALYQALANCDDLSTLSADEIAAVGAKYDIQLAQQRVAEVKAVYDTFVESVIPVNEPLKGDEVEKIVRFKDALGLTAEDAAGAHIDVGRRFQRLGNEAGGRAAKSEYKKALNKLIYVSSLVFGERQEAYLLPWKRMFDYNDASLYVAKRDQARALFKAHLDSYGAQLQADREVLAKIKQFQREVRLEDSLAEEVIREATRAAVESHLDKAIECLKRRIRVRDYSDLVKAVEAVIDYNGELEDLSADPEMPPGLSKVTVYGGKFEVENKTRELRDVFRTYLEEQLQIQKEMTEDLEDDLSDLQQILALGNKEAADIVSEVTSKVYRAMLREEVTSGRLDAAASKADVLGDLCTRLNFDPESASALHKQLYRQKLDTLLEKKHLTDSDAAELDRQRRLLCIKKADVRQLHRETCGRLYQEAVDDTLNAGHERFTTKDREAVLKALRDTRLAPELAKELLGASVRKAFMGFITRSRNKPNRLDAAKELKALVYFSNVCVTPLLEDINEVLKQTAEDSQEAARKELAELMIKAKEQSDQEEAAAAAAAVSSEEAVGVSGEHASESAAAEVPAEAPAAATSATEAAAEPSSSPEETVKADVGPPMKADSESDAAEDSGSEAQSKTQAESEGKAKAAAEPEGATVPETLKMSTAGRKKEEEAASTSGKGMRSQKEITLREELDQKDRVDIYRNFLLYCMSGNVINIGMGTSLQMQRDETEFVRLAQLGDILGLTQLDVASVHTGLAEQAFRQQVQSMTAGGNLTADRVKELEDMREKFGLSKESAQKIIKGAQNQHLIANMNAAKASGGLTLQRLLEMEEQGIVVGDVTSDELRASLYTKEMADVLSDGTGEFDRQRFLEELPKRLGIKERRVKAALEGLAKDRKRTTLVQSVSYLRQKKLDDAVKSLNNLLACHKALPSDKPESWQPREELLDLVSVYITKEGSPAKQDALAKVLAVSEQEMESLRGIVDSGQFKLAEEAAEADLF